MITVVGESVVDLVSQDGGRSYIAHPGGSPLNVAIGLARLGRPTAFVARLSGGTPGQLLREHARANGVDLSWSVPAREPATLALVQIDEARQPTYDLYVEGTADWQWQDAEPRLPPRTRVVHAGSLAAWTPPGGDRIAVALARARTEDGMLVSFDPNVRPALLGDPAAARPLVERYLAIAHVVKASEEDLRWLYPGEEPVQAAARWLAAGPDLVVVTRGGEGCAGLTRGGDVVRRPALGTHVEDTVGAGDAFTAGLLDALVRDGHADPRSIRDLPGAALAGVLDHAATVAALTCERAGADPPTREAVAVRAGARRVPR
ncbi:carbohydrate kinase [Acrocarpospora macrocephala]|uniref:Ribokinase n=1 Tax=Acrocarpospora macrocephala TaxID=150177 RepID=A0A5M3X2I2_9ACTN|nr:carbohydrate kinase [Acrocarpospora macrocephala]GES13013.1 ribokinase [Acrocarpospora macrocephala]